MNTKFDNTSSIQVLSIKRLVFPIRNTEPIALDCNNVGDILVKKRSRARVTLGGQCLLLQIRIKMPKILKKKTKYSYESHLDRNITKPLKKIVKFFEIRPQSSKNAQKAKKM